MSDRTHVPPAAFLLAAVAGCVDAVGFIQLEGYFVAAMSGNATRMGIALAQGFTPAALFLLGLAALFTGGAAAGELVGRRFPERRGAVLLAIVAALLAAAATFFDMLRPAHAIPLMAAAMGMANVALLRGDGGTFGVSHVTGALVEAGRMLAARPEAGRGRQLLGQLLLWAALAAGVWLGAAGHARFGGGVLRVPAALLLAAAIVHWRPKPR